VTEHNAEGLFTEGRHLPQINKMTVWTCALLAQSESFSDFQKPVHAGHRCGDKHFSARLQKMVACIKAVNMLYDFKGNDGV